MGSGSSKKSPPPPKKTAPPKPVANVNKQDNGLERGREQVDFNQNSDRDAENARRKEEEENNKKQERENEKERIKKMKMEEKQEKEREKERSKKMKMEESKPKESMLTFEDDSDLDNDIDEVLKMPMAIEYPKPKKKDKKEKKDKNKKAEEVMNYDNKLERDLFNTNSNSNGYSRDEDLPETYAQRLQRKQYKLQQDLLIRQKTMHRNANEWNDFDDEEDDNFKNQGFDASKFRAANKGGDTKKDIFKTSTGQEDLETPRYLQSDQDNMDDFQVARKPASPNRPLPSYNQSEIDLMNELERDLL